MPPRSISNSPTVMCGNTFRNPELLHSKAFEKFLGSSCVIWQMFSLSGYYNSYYDYFTRVEPVFLFFTVTCTHCWHWQHNLLRYQHRLCLHVSIILVAAKHLLSVFAERWITEWRRTVSQNASKNPVTGQIHYRCCALSHRSYVSSKAPVL